MTELNYKEELNQLRPQGEKLEWYQPTEGKHTIRILEVGKTFISEWKGKETTKIRLTIQCIDKEIDLTGPKLNWSVTIGETDKSLYGQLMKLGNLRGKLENESFTLFVSGDGVKRTYLIEEALGASQSSVSHNFGGGLQ